MVQDDNIDRLLQQGHEQLDRGEYQAALKIFQQAIQLEPENPKVLYGLGLACYWLEQYQESVDYLNQALQLQLCYILALVRRGMAYQNLKLNEQATADFEQAIRIEPQNHEDWRGRGIALAQLKRYEEAISSYDKALEIKSDYYYAWVNRGNALKNLRRYQEAVASYDKAIEIKPDYYYAWNGRGNALKNLRRYQEAIASSDKAIEIKPDYYYAWNNRGYALYELGRYEDAISSYDKALEIQPDYHYAWNNRGNALKNLGRYEEAIASYDKAIEIKPDSHYAWNGRGDALGNLGRYDEAIANFDKALIIKSDYPNAWFMQSFAMYQLGQYKKAIISCDQGIKIQPDKYRGWYIRSTILQQLGRYEEAIASYDKVIEIKPDYYNAWNGRGDELTNLGRYEEAITSYDKALAIKPDSHYAWNERGIALKNLGRYEEAIASYDKALAIKPDSHYAWNRRGSALAELKRYEEAIANFDKALEIKSDYHYAWNERGYALIHLGRYEEAIASYDKALAIKPDSHNAWNSRGYALYKLGRYEEALASCDKALEIKPDYHHAWDNRGAALANLGRYQEAIPNFDKALEIKPDSYNAWDNRGALLEKLGRYQEAITNFDKALEIQPDYHLAWNNRGWTLFNLKRYDEAFQNWEEGRQHLQSETPDHREGRGELYYSEGRVYYLYGQQQLIPYEYWFKAKSSYEEARKLFDTGKTRRRQLNVLQDLIRVCEYLNYPEYVEELLQQGTYLLNLLGQDLNLKEDDYLKLQQEFAGFNQLQVDTLAQSPDPTNHIQALELAEKRKNTCLSWLRYGTSHQISSPNYQQMQQLLNPHTAAIYWHISPAAITTFILKHNQPPHVLKHQPDPSRQKQSQVSFFSKPEKPYHATAYQLKEFETWLKEWKKDYQNYCNIASTGNTVTTKANTPWRQKLTSKLRHLEEILNIPGILEHLKDINQLILIPHRDLHLLPLHYLFPQRFTITYLPSIQLGWNLQPSESFQSLLTLENPSDDLHFTTLAAQVISSLYPQCQLIDIANINKDELINHLKAHTGTFQFAGHAYHNIEQPKESALVLTHEQTLTLTDIFEKLDFGCYNLVFLSACETGITSNQNLIDEYVGLVSAFLAKGTTYVISTLWTVDERSTALLTIRFYQFLKAGETPVLALKLAQDWLQEVTYNDLKQWYLNLAQEVTELDHQCSAYLQDLAELIETDSDKMILGQRPFENPYHWAGFILTGKPPAQ